MSASFTADDFDESDASDIENSNNVDDESEKKDVLVEINRMIRECGELRHKLSELRSFVHFKDDFVKNEDLREHQGVTNMNYAILLRICRKILVGCKPLDRLPMSDLKFLQEIAYTAALRVKTKDNVFDNSLEDIGTFVERIQYLRSLLQEAKKNAHLLCEKIEKFKSLK